MVRDNSVSLHPHSQFTSMKHKKLKTIVIISLNVLLCGIIIWFFTQNSILRPYAGSFLKEALSAMLLLGSLYANYFLLYPKIYQKHSEIIYWITVVFISIAVAVADMAIAYPFIVSVNGKLVEEIGFYKLFGWHLIYISSRDLSLNIFPFLLRERLHYRQSLEKEVQVVYRDVQKLDVVDKDSNIHLVDIRDIFYCRQLGNYTSVATVRNETYTRLGSMKHLEQLFGKEEFIRITSTLLVPFQYIQSCQDNVVVMRKMPWEKNPTAFQLEPKTGAEIAERIAEFMRLKNVVSGGKEGVESSVSTVGKRKPATPPDEKIREVLSYIENHANCNSADIIAGTKYSLSTVERCLSELRKQGLIEHTGSKKSGGYRMVH